MSFEFLIVSLIVVVSPGPGALLSLAAGLNHGNKASIITAFGCTLGILPHLLAATTGLASVMMTDAFAFSALKYAGVAYLIWMGVRTLRDNRAFDVQSGRTRQGSWQVIWNSILINVLNPKLSMFFLAFLPQFISPAEAHPIYRMLELSLVFMAMTFVVFALYGLFAARIRETIFRRPAILVWMRRSFALGFVCLGIKLSMTGQS